MQHWVLHYRNKMLVYGLCSWVWVDQKTSVSRILWELPTENSFKFLGEDFPQYRVL